MSGKKATVRKTPVRSSLKSNSQLLPLVHDGLGAVKKGDRGYLDEAIRSDFGDSIDIDAAFHQGHEQENRWDYLLGHSPTKALIAVEPHSAKQDEVTAIIKKKQGARAQIGPHLRDGAKIATWLWVASGPVHFADTEAVRRRLDQNGIKFVGKRVQVRHLPDA